MIHPKYTELKNIEASYLIVRVRIYDHYCQVRDTVQPELRDKVIHLKPDNFLKFKPQDGFIYCADFRISEEKLKQRGFNLEYMVKRKN